MRGGRLGLPPIITTTNGNAPDRQVLGHLFRIATGPHRRPGLDTIWPWHRSSGGWSPAALDFYRRLEEENTRPFWLANKATFDQEVRARLTP